MSAPDLLALEATIEAREGRWKGGELRFRCPKHEDTKPSARWNREKQTWYCDPCGKGGGWSDLADLLGVTLGRGGGGSPPSRKGFEHSNTSAGLKLAEYAATKQLPEDFLRSVGCSDVTYQGHPAVRMVYADGKGGEAAIRFRIQLDKGEQGDNRFRWKSGAKPCLYGLDRLDAARQLGRIACVEGESDTQSLWFHGEPAFGLPGAGNWREDRDAPQLEGIERIDVVIEPDRGGEAVKGWLGRSAIRERAYLVSIEGAKDPSELHCQDPERFAERWQAALATAVPWSEYARQQADADAAEAYGLARDLLHDPRLLERVGEVMRARGYAGELRPPLIGYVALTSRLLERPLNAAFVAQSSAGKNRAVDAGLELLPADAAHVEKAGSARALVYTDADFQHRAVVVAEADSIPEDGPAASAIRSLAADNEMSYDVVEKNPKTNRFETRRIRKPGPTNLITTYTRSLGAQLGTRMLEVSVPDDPEQTRAIMRAHARSVQPAQGGTVDVEAFIALQHWLALAGERRVAVPFAGVLAELVPPGAVRMRRDFRQLLTCIQALALLYQCQRTRTTEGWVLASVDDYTGARELLAPIFDTLAAEGLTPALRATVEAVADGEEISEAVLADRLKLAKGTVSWRVRRAVKAGWLVNNESRRGHPARLSRGGPLPEERSALPSPDQVREAFECSTANRDERGTPSPSPNGHVPRREIEPEAGEEAPPSPNATPPAAERLAVRRELLEIGLSLKWPELPIRRGVSIAAGPHAWQLFAQPSNAHLDAALEAARSTKEMPF